MPKIKYSELELKILGLIPDDGTRVNTLEIVSKVYDNPPKSARQSVLVSLRRLIDKSNKNEEEWEIFRSSRKRGSNPIYFWSMKREKT